MGRVELVDVNHAALGEAPAADTFFELGMMYSVGRSVPIDYVVAHKWFNLAALKGSEEARYYRCELSREMTPGEVHEAQRLARAWLTLN